MPKSKVESVFPDFHESAYCQKGWEKLWKEFKEGGLEARFAFVFLSMENFLIVPGVHDVLEKIRLENIVGVYALGYKAQDPLSQELLDDLPKIIASDYENKESAQTRKFFECIKKTPSQLCARIGLELKIVPPLEPLIKKIDAAQLEGKKPRCFEPKKEKYDGITIKHD